MDVVTIVERLGALGLLAALLFFGARHFLTRFDTFVSNLAGLRAQVYALHIYLADRLEEDESRASRAKALARQCANGNGNKDIEP